MADPADTVAQQVYATLGRRIRAARLGAGLSQQAAAIKVGVDLRWWQRLESGQQGMTVRTLVRAALGLEVTFWALVSDERYEGDPPPLRPARRRRH